MQRGDLLGLTDATPCSLSFRQLLGQSMRQLLGLSLQHTNMLACVLGASPGHKLWPGGPASEGNCTQVQQSSCNALAQTLEKVTYCCLCTSFQPRKKKSDNLAKKKLVVLQFVAILQQGCQAEVCAPVCWCPAVSDLLLFL